MPWLCATAGRGNCPPININTLTSMGRRRSGRCSRPGRFPSKPAPGDLGHGRPAGWVALVAGLYRTRELIALILPLDVQLQPQLRTRWFRADLDVALQGAELHETALVDARVAPARVVARRWGSDD
jgi:general secretion pathway protein K